MPLVKEASASACRAERLAGARARPNWPIVSPPSHSQGKGPSADTGKEVALGVTSEVVGSNVTDVPFVYVASREVPCGDQFAQPLRRVGVMLVVIGAHGR